MKRIHLIISGDVHGVLFRSNSEEIAKKLGIKGWVKNTSSGEVEIVAEGEEDSLEKLISWCKQGPSYAKVENVEINWEDAAGEFTTFYTRY